MVIIGKLIQKRLKERGMSNAEFARRINTHIRNVYDIFNRKSIDTDLLIAIGEVLDYDFFSHYSKTISKSDLKIDDPLTGYEKESEFLKIQEKLNELKGENEQLKERLKDKEIIIKLMREQLKDK